MTLLQKASSAGFSLVETLVAVSLVTIALVTLAQLFGLAVESNQRAKRTTLAAMLAGQKMEELRSMAAVFELSPPGALAGNVAGFCEFIDGRGRIVGAGDRPPPGTQYTRRWSIERLSADPDNAVVLQVRVTAGRGRAESRLLSVRARQFT
jgi:type II secretory pathway pseudopilin PulG